MNQPSMRPLATDWREAGVHCALQRILRQAGDSAPGWAFGGSFEEAARRAGGGRAAAATRVALGERLERFAAEEIETICPASNECVPEDADTRRRACQLYFDSYCAAVWTSAHVEYLIALDSNIAEPVAPNIATVPCASSALDLSDLYARRLSSKNEAYPKAVEPLVQLLARCSNPGSRGWESVLAAAMENAGSRSIVIHAVIVCLIGLHPQIHPSHRPDWRARLRILRLAPSKTSEINAVAVHVKEAIRRFVASIMAGSLAMHTALSLAGHPVRHLTQPPATFPHAGMDKAMSNFADAGIRMTNGETWPSCLSDAFGTSDDSYKYGWLGKGTANVHARQSLVHVAGDVWAAAFKANFMAFWIFAQSHNLRVCRLDSTQHRAIHGMNKATKLAAQMDEATALAVQRIVLKNPSAGIATLCEVAAELGIEGIFEMRSGIGARSATDCVNLIGAAGQQEAAKLLAYARAAWVCEEVITVDLGTRARELQIRALCKRLRLPEGTSLDRMPLHATHVVSCSECRRVSNAHATTSSTTAFNELGIMSCQINMHTPDGKVRMHCAKRSSAALRTALQSESDMNERRIECEEVDRSKISRLVEPRRISGSEVGIAARVRRDAKNALEQRITAVGCGENPMFTVPVVGRAVRVYKGWFALCSYCATLTRIQNGIHFYGADICCQRCDHEMLGVKDMTLDTSVTGSSGRICRFCGSVERLNTTGAKWRELKAPLDIAGANATLPPPLRRVCALSQLSNPVKTTIL